MNVTEYDVQDTSSDLVTNQILEGHSATVICLAWNEPFQKLVSTDENGLTIVWGFQDEIWYQEMVNSRNNSYVTDMKWTNDGKLICITYDDGTVTVGSVEGNKLWGLELGISLRHVEWSANYSNVIFVSKENKIQVYDKVGSHIKDVKCCEIDEISGIHWYDGQQKRNNPSLAIVSVTGQICLTRNIGHTNSLVVKSGLSDGICKWSPNGSIIAICGKKQFAFTL